MKSFWVNLTLLVILGPKLVVLGQTNKKVNCSTRRRHISAAYLTSFLFLFLFRTNKSRNIFHQHFQIWFFALSPILESIARPTAKNAKNVGATFYFLRKKVNKWFVWRAAGISAQRTWLVKHFIYYFFNICFVVVGNVFCVCAPMGPMGPIGPIGSRQRRLCTCLAKDVTWKM